MYIHIYINKYIHIYEKEREREKQYTEVDTDILQTDRKCIEPVVTRLHYQPTV